MEYRRLVMATAAGLSLIVGNTQASTRALTSNGIPIRWSKPYVEFAGNPSNQSGFLAGAFFSAVVKGLQRWQKASEDQVTFNYWQGTDQNFYPTAIAYDGLSTVSLLTGSSGGSSVGANNVIGLTQLWYNAQNGELFEADVVLNDANFVFTTDPTDTTGYGSGKTPSAGMRPVYIENVLTHELGHALGVGHSGALQSTMLFLEAPEQAHLGCDDQSAIQVIYPGASRGATGALAGSVNAPGGGAVFGAQVLAISVERGTVMASGVTDSAGRYAIEGLVPGQYAVLVEPFAGGAAALPAYYASSTATVCSGSQKFRRTLLTVSGSPDKPRLIAVSAGGRVQAPTLTVSCTGAGATVPTLAGTDRVATAPVIADASSGKASISFSDRLALSGSSTDAYYKLANVSGDLRFQIHSFTLYSPLGADVELLDRVGNPLPSSLNVQIKRPAFTGTSGFINYDVEVEALGLPDDDYIVHVTAASTNVSRYPAGQVALDTANYLMILGSVNGGSGQDGLEGVMPLGARCTMTENFSAYQSPGGNPPRHALAKGSDKKGGIFGCGMVSSNRPGSAGTQGTRESPSLGQVLSALLPLLLMMAVTRLAIIWEPRLARRPLRG